MNFQIGCNLASQFKHTDVLHDDSVYSGFRYGGYRARCFGEFVFEDEGVEGEVAADTTAVQGLHHAGQFVKIKAYLGAGTEVFEAEIAGVRAGLDGGVQLRPVASRTHHFGLFRGGHELLPG